MKTEKLNLTNTAALRLPAPKSGQAIYWDTGAAGLGVRITAAEARSWIVQGRVNGKSRRFTLGPISELDYKDAREKANAIRKEMRTGTDPLAEKRKKLQETKAQGETLRDVMVDYIEHKHSRYGPLRPSSKADIRRCVEGAFSDWADKPVATITRDDCIKRFRKLSKTAPIKANQVFRNLRALLNWAREKNATNDGTYPILPVNPVSQIFKNVLVKWNPENARTTRIPRDRIGAVWVLLEENGDPDLHRDTTCISADLIAFMLLTGTRASEANQLTWDRVKLDDKVPTFHLAVTKNHIPITLPVSDALHRVLSRRYTARKKGNNFVFPAMRGEKGFLADPRALFKKVSEVAGVHLHPHSLRRTFDDVALICGVDSDQRRRLLNHKAHDVHGTNYTNNPDPAVLMPAAQKVGEWISRQGEIARTPVRGGNVVPLRRR